MEYAGELIIESFGEIKTIITGLALAPVRRDIGKV
jgi:hypothetical protein